MAAKDERTPWHTVKAGHHAAPHYRHCRPGKQTEALGEGKLRQSKSNRCSSPLETSAKEKERKGGRIL